MSDPVPQIRVRPGEGRRVRDEADPRIVIPVEGMTVTRTTLVNRRLADGDLVEMLEEEEAAEPTSADAPAGGDAAPAELPPATAGEPDRPPRTPRAGK